MTKGFYLSELDLLREVAPQFSLANPALAPFLHHDSIDDPDVERLLQAVAYNNALLRRKLESGLPELVQSLTRLMLPHYLRPFPATTVVSFATSVPSRIIRSGAQFDSAPVDGTRCRFRTTADIEIHPLEIIDAGYEQHSQRSGAISLSLALKETSLSRWQPKAVRFFLAGGYVQAAELCLLFRRHLTRISVCSPGSESSCDLPVTFFRWTGCSDGERLLPAPPRAFPAYHLLQEYFCMPQKFLFFELAGWDQWRQRGKGGRFTLCFHFDNLLSEPRQIRREDFTLNAVPAVNLFSHHAEPIRVDHHTGRYLLRPFGLDQRHCDLFSVDRVVGYTRGSGEERRYLPFERYTGCDANPVFQVMMREVESGGYRSYLDLAFPAEMLPPGAETLSIDLTCSNGTLAERIQVGDLSLAASSCSDFVTSSNITRVNPSHPPPLGPKLLRRLSSHLCLNQLSLGKTEHLRQLLELHLPLGSTSGLGAPANRKRVDGIETVEVKQGEFRQRGSVLRGQEITIGVREDHFAGRGDLFLFGAVLDEFLGRYSAINSYTRLTFRETTTGGTLQWPIRLGSQIIRS